jgi:hypothetical protein
MSLIKVDWRPGERQLRTFGAICGVGCLALGVWAMQRHTILGIGLTPPVGAQVGYGLWGIAGVTAALSLAAPRALWPLYVTLTAISLPIGFAVSHLVVAILFYGVLTPFGLVFRLVGRDPLERRFDRSRDSYWVARHPVTDSNRYFHQY